MTLVSSEFVHNGARYKVDHKGNWQALAFGFFINDPHATCPKHQWIPIPKENVPKAVLNEAGM